jgi:hypothetical protein
MDMAEAEVVVGAPEVEVVEEIVMEEEDEVQLMMPLV